MRSLLLVVLCLLVGNTWAAIRKPVTTAFPQCDADVLRLLQPLSHEERDFVTASAAENLMKARVQVNEHRRTQQKLVGRESQFPGVRERARAAEGIEAERLERCQVLFDRHVSAESATSAALVNAQFLDLDFLPVLLKAGAKINMTRGSGSREFILWHGMVEWTLTASRNLFPSEHASDLLRRYLDLVLANVRNIDFQDRSGRTVLHILAEHRMSLTGGSNEDVARDVALRKLIEAGANPRLRNKAGKLPLDLYTGNDKEIIGLLAGAPRQNSAEAPDTLRERGKGGRTAASTSGADLWHPLRAGSFTGHITSTLNKGNRIEGKLELRDDGSFEYLGNNGVRLAGQLALGDNNRVLGAGTSYLPTVFGMKLFAYPGGATSADIQLTGKVDGGELSGTFRSPHETGTFAFARNGE